MSETATRNFNINSLQDLLTILINNNQQKFTANEFANILAELKDKNLQFAQNNYQLAYKLCQRAPSFRGIVSLDSSSMITLKQNCNYVFNNLDFNSWYIFTKNNNSSFLNSDYAKLLFFITCTPNSTPNKRLNFEQATTIISKMYATTLTGNEIVDTDFDDYVLYLLSCFGKQVLNKNLANTFVYYLLRLSQLNLENIYRFCHYCNTGAIDLISAENMFNKVNTMDLRNEDLCKILRACSSDDGARDYVMKKYKKDLFRTEYAISPNKVNTKTKLAIFRFIMLGKDNKSAVRIALIYFAISLMTAFLLQLGTFGIPNPVSIFLFSISYLGLAHSSTVGLLNVVDIYTKTKYILNPVLNELNQEEANSQRNQNENVQQNRNPYTNNLSQLPLMPIQNIPQYTQTNQQFNDASIYTPNVLIYPQNYQQNPQFNNPSYPQNMQTYLPNYQQNPQFTNALPQNPPQSSTPWMDQNRLRGISEANNNNVNLKNNFSFIPQNPYEQMP